MYDSVYRIKRDGAFKVSSTLQYIVTATWRVTDGRDRMRAQMMFSVNIVIGKILFAALQQCNSVKLFYHRIDIWSILFSRIGKNQSAKAQIIF